MTLLDYLPWAAILVAGLALGTWYGASWRAVTKALGRTDQPVDEEPSERRQPTGNPARQPTASGTTP